MRSAFSPRYACMLILLAGFALHIQAGEESTALIETTLRPAGDPDLENRFRRVREFANLEDYGRAIQYARPLLRENSNTLIEKEKGQYRNPGDLVKAWLDKQPEDVRLVLAVQEQARLGRSSNPLSSETAPASASRSYTKDTLTARPEYAPKPSSRTMPDWTRQSPNAILGIDWRQSFPCLLPAPLRLSDQYERFLHEASQDGVGALWVKHHFPTDRLYLSGNQAYYSSRPELYCLDIRDGSLLWSAPGHESEDAFRADDPGDEPLSPAARWHFVDPLGRALTLHRDLVIRVENALPMSPVDPKARREREEDKGAAHPTIIAAYHADTGELSWSRDGRKPTPRVRYTACPVSAENYLLTVCEDRASSFVEALQPETGKTAWKTRLGDHRMGARPGMVASALGVYNETAYVLRGDGLLFALGANNGQLRWAAVYPAPTNREPGPQCNEIAFTATRVVAGPADTDWWVAFDHEGVRQYALARASGEYIAGQNGERLYLSGPESVRAIRIEDGSVIWHKNVPDSYGRALMAETELFVPTVDGILLLSLPDGTRTGRLNAPAIRDETHPFFGNLFAGKNQIFAVGAGHLRALAPNGRLVEQLTKSLEQQESCALRLRRARIFLQESKVKEAVADLKRALACFEDDDPGDAFKGYLSVLTQRKMAELQNDPQHRSLKAAGYLYKAEIKALLDSSVCVETDR